jgi:oligoendopeptidase F
MSNVITAEAFDKAMRDAVRQRLEEIVAEEAAETAKRVSERVRAEADALALKLLSYYDVSRDQRGIVITVRKVAE